MNHRTDCTLDYFALAELERMDLDHGEPQILQDLIAIFLSSTPARLRNLRDAYAVRDFIGVRQVAHNMKSSCGYLGATRLRSLCGRLEAVCHERNHVHAHDLIAEINEEYPRVRAALEMAPYELSRYRLWGEQ